MHFHSNFHSMQPMPPPAHCRVLEVVKKTTGGKAWLPKWGFNGLSPAQKANRKKQIRDEHSVLAALKEAASREPVVANRLTNTSTAPK
jgi:hypothetical protein